MGGRLRGKKWGESTKELAVKIEMKERLRGVQLGGCLSSD